MKFLLLLGLGLFLATPASATITLANTASTSGHISSGVSFTISSTTAGNLIVILIQMEGTGTGTVTSCTDGGDTFTVLFASVALTSTTRTGGYCYVLSGAGGKTSATVNFTTADGYIATAFEYNFSVGTAILDVSTSTSLISSTSTPIGPSVTTTGANDVITALLVTNNAGATGNLANTGVTFTLEANPSGAFNKMGSSDLINIAVGTYAPKWQMDSGDTSASIVVAFKEPSVAGNSGSKFGGPARISGPSKIAFMTQRNRCEDSI